MEVTATEELEYALLNHNKEEPYLFDTPLKDIASLEDMNKATRTADGRIVAVIYYGVDKEAY